MDLFFNCCSSDLQLAIALQQQEFEQQPPRHNSQQPSVTGSSRLVTGPQVNIALLFYLHLICRLFISFSAPLWIPTYPWYLVPLAHRKGGHGLVQYRKLKWTNSELVIVPKLFHFHQAFLN